MVTVSSRRLSTAFLLVVFSGPACGRSEPLAGDGPGEAVGGSAGTGGSGGAAGGAGGLPPLSGGAGPGGLPGAGGTGGGVPPTGGAAGALGFCGDGFLDIGEECDGPFSFGLTCRDLGFQFGEVRCGPSCFLDFSSCAGGMPFCGDGNVDAPEELCDGNDLGGLVCEDFGLGPGSLSCGSGCEVDVSGCSRCGNGVIDDGEGCDATDFGGRTCFSIGFAGGDLGCAADCNLDVSGCSRCGNGFVEAGERCDGDNLGGLTCNGLGLGSGTLACAAVSCFYDTSGCAAGPSCNNGVLESGEQCDGIIPNRCEDFGFSGGELQCNLDTCRVDTSGCNTAPSPDCAADCIEDECRELLELCSGTSQCEAILECLDGCRDDPSFNCGVMCATDFNALAVAIVAADCVRDCTLGCL